MVAPNLIWPLWNFGLSFYNFRALSVNSNFQIAIFEECRRKKVCSNISQLTSMTPRTFLTGYNIAHINSRFFGNFVKQVSLSKFFNNCAFANNPQIQFLAQFRNWTESKIGLRIFRSKQYELWWIDVWYCILFLYFGRSK